MSPKKLKRIHLHKFELLFIFPLHSANSRTYLLPNNGWTRHFSTDTCYQHMPKSQLNMLKSACLNRDSNFEVARSTKHTLREVAWPVCSMFAHWSSRPFMKFDGRIIRNLQGVCFQIRWILCLNKKALRAMAILPHKIGNALYIGFLRFLVGLQ
jgi:hypothetical protein